MLDTEKLSMVQPRQGDRNGIAHDTTIELHVGERVVDQIDTLR